MAALRDLLERGVIGSYTHFEATEIFAIRGEHDLPINIFTILVTENREGEAIPEQPSYLTPKPFRLKKSLPAWKFGIKRYVRPISNLTAGLGAMASTGQLTTSGESLLVGTMHEVAPQFVPPDSMAPVPWNRVLKNNFWNGSHVFEWSDGAKTALQPFFDDPRLLQELSGRICKCVPIVLAALSDRLGNVAVQLPVNAMLSQHHGVRPIGAFNIEIAWAPNVEPRTLRGSCELEFDGIISGYASAPIQAANTSLAVPRGLGTHRIVIWDDFHQVLLAATGPSAFINSIGLNMHVVGGDPRTFSRKEADGSSKQYRIGVSHKNKSVVGDITSDDTGARTRKRMYKDQLDQLMTSRVFVQYRPEAHRVEISRQKALEDLRVLIRQHGDEGAWLWDPYLTARDILETLFYCPHSGSDLRGLTGAEQPREARGKQGFVEQQRAELEATQSNWLGLRLEYRVRHGSAGFGFHDRFLIFPKKDDNALAWSLGTSVNSAGTAHHILQQADNGQFIRDAFIELWENLDQPEHLIWKKP
jgi:hypothetical protein